MEKYFGTYVVDLSEDENIDAFCEKQGLPPQAVNAMKTPGVTRTFGINSDGTYFSEVNHPMHKNRQDFKLSEPFESVTPMGKLRITFVMDGEILCERVVDCKNRESLIKLVIENGNLIARMDGDGIIAKRVFKKI